MWNLVRRPQNKGCRNDLETKPGHHMFQNGPTCCDSSHQTQSIVSYSQFVRSSGLAISHHYRVQNSTSANLVDWSQVGRNPSRTDQAAVFTALFSAEKVGSNDNAACNCEKCNSRLSTPCFLRCIRERICCRHLCSYHWCLWKFELAFDHF